MIQTKSPLHFFNVNFLLPFSALMCSPISHATCLILSLSPVEPNNATVSWNLVIFSHTSKTYISIVSSWRPRNRNLWEVVRTDLLSFIFKPVAHNIEQRSSTTLWHCSSVSAMTTELLMFGNIMCPWAAIWEQMGLMICMNMWGAGGKSLGRQVYSNNWLFHIEHRKVLSSQAMGMVQ